MTPIRAVSKAIEPVHPNVALGDMGSQMSPEPSATQDRSKGWKPSGSSSTDGAPSPYHSRMPARHGRLEGTGRVTGQVDAGTGLLARPLPLHDFGREPGTGEHSGGAETGDASADDEDAR